MSEEILQDQTGLGTAKKVPLDLSGLTDTAVLPPPQVIEPTPMLSSTPVMAGAKKVPLITEPAANIPDDPREVAIRLSSDPVQAAAKVDASIAIGKWLDLHPGTVHANFDALTEHIWGAGGKRQPPATVWQKIVNTAKAPIIDGRLNDINGRMYLREDSPELMTEREALKKERAALGPTIGWVPDQLVGIAYQLGYQGVNAAVAVAGAAVAGVEFFAENALNVLTVGLLGKMIHLDYGALPLRLAENASSKVFGSLVGGAYGAMIDRGVDPTTARWFAGGLGALQVGLTAIPLGKAATQPIIDAAVEGALRASLNGGVGKVAAFLGMDAASAGVAGAITKQAAFAVSMSAVNAVMPEVAGALTNAARNEERSQAATRGTLGDIASVPLNVQLKSPGELATEIAKGSVGQFLVGGGMEALNLAVRAHVETLAEREVARAQVEQALKDAEAAKAVPEEPLSAHPIEVATREKLANSTFDDFMDSRPSVPEVGAGMESATREAAVAGASERLQRAESELARPGAAQEAFAQKEAAILKEMDDALQASKDKYEKAKANPDADIFRTRRDRTIKKRYEPQLETLRDEMKATLEDAKNIEALRAETATTTAGAEARYTESVVVSKAKNVKMTEEEGRALDEATRSEEGSSNYIENSPDIRAMNDEILSQVDQVDKLTTQIEEMRLANKEALDAARSEKIAALEKLRTEKNERIAGLKAAIPAARKSLAAQLKVRAEAVKLINNLASIDTSKLPNEIVHPITGERVKIKAPLDEFLAHFNTKNPSEKTLHALLSIRDAIADGATPTQFPANYLKRLNELSKFPLKKLSIDDLRIVHDAAMAYYRAGREEVVRTRQGLEMKVSDALRTIVEDELKPEELTKRLQDYLEENIGQVRKSNGELMTKEELRAQFSEANTGGSIERMQKALVNVFDMFKYGNLSFETMMSLLGGGEDSLLYQIGFRPLELGTDVHVRKGFEYGDVMYNWMSDNELVSKRSFSNFLNTRRKVDVEGFHGEMEAGEIIAMAGIKATEGGWDSLKEGGFARTNDKLFNKVYHPTEEGLNQILSTMTKQEKSFLDMILDIGRKTGKDMAPVFRAMFGYDLHLFDPYYVLNRHRGLANLEKEALQNREASTFTHAGVDESHTIDRVGSKKALRLNNVGNDIAEVIDNSSMFVGLADAVRTTSRIIFNEKFATAVKRTMGDTFYRQLTDGLKAIAGTRRVLNTFDKWIVKAQHRGAAGILGWSPSTMAYNALLVGRSAAGYVPMHHWAMANVLVSAHAPTWNRWLMENVPLYRQISEKGAMPEVQAILNEKDAGKGIMGAFSAYQRASLAPMKRATRWGAMRDMAAAVLQARSELKEGILSQDVQRGTGLSDRDGPNLTPAQRTKAEADYATYVFSRIHATPREAFKANMTREGVVGSVLSTLMSDRNAMLQLGIRKAIDIKSPKGGRDFVKYLVMGPLGEALGSAGIKYGLAVGGTAATAALVTALTGREPPPPDPKKQKTYLRYALSELVGNTAGNIIGMSGPLYIGESILTSKSGMTPTANGAMISQYGEDVINMIAKLNEAAKEPREYTRSKLTWEAADAFMSFALPMLLKVPYKHGARDVMKQLRPQ